MAAGNHHLRYSPAREPQRPDTAQPRDVQSRHRQHATACCVYTQYRQRLPGHPRHSDRAQPASGSQVLPGEMGKHRESIGSTRRVNLQPREQKMRFQLLVDLLVCPQLALRTQKRMFHSKALSIFKEQKH